MGTQRHSPHTVLTQSCSMASFLPSSFAFSATQRSKPESNIIMVNLQKALESAKTNLDTVPAIKVHLDAVIHTATQARRGLAVIPIDSRFVTSLLALIQGLTQEFGESLVSVSVGKQGSPRVRAVHGALGRQVITLAQLLSKFQELK